MKALLAAASVLVMIGAAHPAVAQTAKHPEVHTVLTPQEMKWSAGPPALPNGAEASLLYGDPGKAEPFVLRVKLPGNYQIPPHTHPVTEVVTVLSGTFKLGSGEVIDKAKAKPLAAGSFFAFSPGMTHFAYTDEETIVQISSMGPWGITYVNPNDDPRQKTQ